MPIDASRIITGEGLYALMPISIMPVVLLAAMRMTAFVKNSFLEYDERDDEPRPYLGFFLKSTFIGAVLAAVVYLCGELMETTIFAGRAILWRSSTYMDCFRSAAW